jgi:hypothetical protein
VKVRSCGKYGAQAAQYFTRRRTAGR